MLAVGTHVSHRSFVCWSVHLLIGAHLIGDWQLSTRSLLKHALFTTCVLLVGTFQYHYYVTSNVYLDRVPYMYIQLWLATGMVLAVRAFDQGCVSETGTTPVDSEFTFLCLVHRDGGSSVGLSMGAWSMDSWAHRSTQTDVVGG